MNFQTVIKLPYVINLIYAILNNNSFSHPDNNIDIISIDNLYYIKDYKKNLYIINEDMGNNKYSKLQQILKTCIHFEEYKEFPINSFSLRQTKPIERGLIDIELLKILQIQYAFNNLNLTLSDINEIDNEVVDDSEYDTDNEEINAPEMPEMPEMPDIFGLNLSDSE